MYFLLFSSLVAVNSVWNDKSSGGQPAESEEHQQPELLVDEGDGGDDDEKYSLTQHPGVGGEHGVGGEEVEGATPDWVPRPNRRSVEDAVVPRQPAGVVQRHRDEQVAVHRGPLSRCNN